MGLPSEHRLGISPCFIRFYEVLSTGFIGICEGGSWYELNCAYIVTWCLFKGNNSCCTRFVKFQYCFRAWRAIFFVVIVLPSTTVIISIPIDAVAVTTFKRDLSCCIRYAGTLICYGDADLRRSICIQNRQHRHYGPSSQRKRVSFHVQNCVHDRCLILNQNMVSEAMSPSLPSSIPFSLLYLSCFFPGSLPHPLKSPRSERHLPLKGQRPQHSKAGAGKEYIGSHVGHFSRPGHLSRPSHSIPEAVASGVARGDGGAALYPMYASLVWGFSVF